MRRVIGLLTALIAVLALGPTALAGATTTTLPVGHDVDYDALGTPRTPAPGVRWLSETIGHQPLAPAGAFVEGVGRISETRRTLAGSVIATKAGGTPGGWAMIRDAMADAPLQAQQGTVRSVGSFAADTAPAVVNKFAVSSALCTGHATLIVELTAGDPRTARSRSERQRCQHRGTRSGNGVPAIDSDFAAIVTSTIAEHSNILDSLAAT